MIPVRNGASHLPRCLQSIQAAGDGPSTQIIVVDNGSTDDSVAVATRFGAQALVRPALRVGALRNAGVQASSGAIVAFVDADQEIVREWVACCRAALSEEGVGAVGRMYEAPRPGTWVQRAYGCLRDHSPAARDVAWLGAGNLAVWKHVFESVGGFDESVEACEDVDLCRAIRQKGWRIVSEPAMRSIHHGDPATLGAVFRGELWRGRDNLRVSLRERLTLRSAAGVFAPLIHLFLLAVAVVTGAAVPWLGPLPVTASLVALSAIVLMRALTMIRRGSVRTVTGWLECVAVAGTYECGRALSPVLRATHAARAGGAT